MFLSNWLVFKIVLAAVTGLVDYPLAADVLLVYDNANKLYLDGNSIDYVSNVVLYKGETSYEIEGPNVIVGDEQKITASNADADDEFGSSVAISGDYAIVGAKLGDEASTSDAGAAYIFKHNGTSWSEQQIITASNPDTSDYFGGSVSLSGDYAIVGATREDGEKGTAYIFKRSGTSWSEQKKITSSDAASGDLFGSSVSIDGDYAIVGAPNHNNGAGSNSGSAYIFKRDGTSWSEQEILVASDTASSDLFGYSVGISGDYAIVGRRQEGAFIFKRSGTSWSEQQSLTASDAEASDYFGWSVSISGDYAIVGAKYEDDGGPNAGAAYIFKRNGTSWSQEAKLTASDAYDNDQFGHSVSISGDYAIVGAWYEDDGGADAGATYIFKRSGTSWSEQQKLTASDAEAGDEFGYSVGISGNYVIAGARVGDSTTAADSGSTYIYPLKQVTNYYITQPGTYRADLQICGIDYKTNEVEVTGSITPFKKYSQTQKFTGNGSSNDNFGFATDIHGDYAIVGEYGYNGSRGRAYIYHKSNGVWDLQSTLYPSPAADDNFGYSVAISADYAVVGARYDDDNGNAAGSVYLYKRTGTSWGDMQFIIAGTEYPFDIAQYGNSVAISGDYFIVGSEGDSPAGRSNYAGSAYIYQISSTQSATRSSEEYIVQSGSSGGEGYGSSVGISGDYAIVGPANTTTPDIYIYKRTTGNTWTEHQKIQNIGVTVAINGDYVIIGNPTTRKAYIYILTNNTTWSQQAELTGAESVSGDRFGWSVSIHGEYAVVGASAVDTNTGAVYVFKRTGTSWSQYDRIQASDKAQNHYFAYNTNGLQINNGTIIVGGYGNAPSTGGSAYIFNNSTVAALTFDGYNQLSLTNTPTYTSSKLAYGSNVYDIGTLTSDITIEKQGEYASLTFDTSSNVAYFSNATVNTIATNPLENYRSVTKLDAGVQHSSFQAGTICFWAKALDSGPNYFDGFNTDRGFLQLTTQETYTDHASYGVINLANSTKIRCFSGTTNNSVYTEFANPPYNDGYDPAKWNFYIVYTDSNSGTSYMYLPEFGWSASSSTYGRDHTWLRFDIDDNYVALTDVSVYTGNTGNTESWRTTLYNNGQIGGAANETTNRVHYFRFHKDNLRYNEGTAATDISSSAEMSTSLSLPTFDGVPQLTHDTYNKLSVQNITPTATTLRLDSNTYDIGTATDIYIEDTGTYEAAITASDKFALVSNVVTGLNDPVYITPKLDGGAIYVNGALDDNGSLYLWGLGDNGQLGQGDTNNSTSPVQVKGVGGAGFLENIVDFKCGTGDAFVVACDSSGNCYAWGNNSDGYLGQGDLNGSYTPLQVKGVGGTGFLENIINVCAGHKTAYACDSSGNAYAWGDNYYNSSNTQGMLGDGTIVDKTTPVQVVGVGGSGYLTDIIQVSAAGGGRSGYALSSSGSVYAWGGNTNGQLGNGTYTGSLTPVQVVGVGGTGYLSGIIKLAESTYSYSYQKIALGSDGRVYAWGGGGFGELGQGNTSNSNTPVIVKGVGGTGYLENIIDIAEGGYHCFALDSSGTVYAWGRNASESPIGDGTSTQRETPVKVLGVGGTGYLSNIVAIGGERFGGSAMDADGNVYAWGGNQNYQVGDGTNTSRTSPVQVLGVGGTGFLDLKTKVPPPSLNFDTYNKLSIENITPTATTLTYGSNTYDLTTQTDIYIDKVGTYEAGIKDANTFVFASNTVTTVNSITEKIPLVSWTNLGTSLTSDDGVHTFTSDGSNYSQVSGSTDNYITNTGNERLYIDLESLRSREKAFTFEYEIYGPQWKFGAQFGNLLGTISSSHEADSIGFHFGAAHSTDLGLHSPNVNLVYTTGENENDFGTSRWVKIRWTREANSNTIKLYIDDVYKNQITADSSSTNNTSYTDYGIKSHITLFRHDWNSTTDQYAASGTRIRNIKLWDTVDIKIPKLTFDTYNKLSIENIIPTSTTLRLDSNTYDIGTITDIYIDKAGTYEIETKDANTFALVSNVVGAISTQSTLAFHYGAFSLSDYSSAYSTVGAAATAGFVYSDTTPATYTWGTLNSVDTSTSGQTGYSWTPTTTMTADVLMVAGGGGGGSATAGGGGAGGLLHYTNQSLSGQKTIVVGNGGTGGLNGYGTDGSSTSFTSLTTAVGGGGGGKGGDGRSGGSGGGAGSANITSGGSGTSGQGNAGGSGYSYNYKYSGGGGGGAGGVGNNSSLNVGGDGGDGIDKSSTFGMSYGVSGWFAGGGGGAGYTNLITEKSSGGIGGGGGGIRDSDNPQNGQKHTGGGGGGALGDLIYGGSGGSGIVIIRPSAPPSLTHDGYKLVVSGITPTSTTLKYGSNTYEIGTATNIYVENTGDYSAEIGSAADFAFTSNVVSSVAQIEPGFASRYQGSMALTYDGKLYAWGMNDDGEAGVGTSSDITVPTLCTGITQGTVAKLLSSSDLTDNSRGEVSYVKTIDGKIYATGKGDNFVIPGTTSDLTSFTDVTSYFGDQSLTANNVTMMSFTQLSGAALTETGNVWTWGTHDSTNKALGQASASSSSTPKQINFSSATGTITKVTCGSVHSLALDTSGDVWFWGKNTINSDSWPSSVTDEPQKVVDGKNIIGLASSYGTMYAWDATGKMWNAGNNWEGQIGDGTTTTNTTGKTLTEVTYFSSNGITINKVYGGGYFVFADTSDGYYCWGSGGHGVFGNGSTGNITSGPAKWTNVSNIKKFMASTNHATAITEDGKYYAWGNGTNNARGDNTTGDITYPKYIDSLPNILAPSFDFDGYDKVFVNDPTIVGYRFGQVGHVLINIGGPQTSDWVCTSVQSDKYIYSKDNVSSGHDFEYRINTNRWDAVYSGDWPVFFGETGTPNASQISPTGSATVLHLFHNYNTNNYLCSLDTNLNSGITTQSIKYTKDTHTYDANQSQIVTVSDPGTYDAQIKDPENFSLKSATVPATKASGLYTWAFHHGNFDNAYGDGDILTARDNGRFYADTPSYTGDIGTITPVNPFGTTQPTLVSSLTITNGKALNTLSYSSYVHRSTDTTNTRYVYALGALSTDTKYDIAYNWVTKKWLDIDSDATHNTFGTSASDTSNTSRISTENPQTVYVMETYWNLLFAIFTNPYYQESLSKTTYTFTPASTLTANVMMVAGGGGGGGVNAGGGGAGGLVYSLNESISTGSKTIVVGNGGLGGEGYSNGIDEIGIRGNDTIFLSYTASGGGGGGSQDSSATTQIDGGSGGGNNGRYDSGIGGSSTQNAYSGKGFGNVGGDGVDDYNGGGGGGAGGAGTDATGNGGTGGTGGIGKYYGNIFGTNYGDDGWFAGGGGGASQTGTGTIGLGGKGGGGRGKEETDTYDIGFHGTSHTGGGGGATGYTAANSNRIGGSGGSGIVLLQTNVATPNVNSEVKIPEPHYHVLIEKSDDIQFSHLPNGIGSGTVHTGGSIVPNIPRADGSVSNVFYATSAEYFYAEQAGSLVSTVEGIFYPIEQQRYDNILEIGDNLNTNNNDVELEMAADGTAKLYRSHGADLIAAGTKVCFTVGKWHHIALTLDTGGNAVGYVNGYPVVSATYSSSVLPGSRREMCLYRTGVTATFQKFLMYYFKTYNSVLNHKQIMQLAGAAGLGPKLEYDGLNAINVVNTEPGSGTDITIYESNVNDTSNLYVVSCNESSYLLSNAGTYYAQIKGTDTFTITRPLTVTDDHFPLYQYPPIDGTTTGLTSSTTSATWTISGVQYSTESSVAGSPYNTFDNSITSGFDSTSSTGDITITFESAKTIRKYIVWPYDSTAPVSTPGGSTDPTLSTDGTFRPKSWTLYGYTESTGWVSLDTVTNQPPSIYGDVHSISSPASYLYYKLSVTANNGGSGLKIGEWQLWGDA
jgi:alpha-tubulin suppressor-like RCC1 family protein